MKKQVTFYTEKISIIWLSEKDTFQEKGILYLLARPLRCHHQVHNSAGILQSPCFVSEALGKIPSQRFCHLPGQLYGLPEAGS